jgi:hypothetical protein
MRLKMQSSSTKFCAVALTLAALIALPVDISGLRNVLAANTPAISRMLYAVNQSSDKRGSISVYDIDHAHALIKTILTVSNVDDVKGVAASAATGRLYVAYRTPAGVGMIFCLNLLDDKVLWNKAIEPDVDRLSINPDGRLLYVPTWEGGAADYINVLDAENGSVIRRVHFSNHSHDTLFPLAGPIFQETKATDGSGQYLYLIDPTSYAVSRIGPYAGILGPYSVDGRSRYVVNNIIGLWGLQVADIKSGRIVTAKIPNHSKAGAGLLQHGIGWTPDEGEVWESSTGGEPYVYVWDMSDPMAPALKDRLALRARESPHWLTFSIKADYAYVAPGKNSGEGTEIFDAHTRRSLGVIGSSEDMLEIDFADGKVEGVGDQFGIGRAAR